MMNLPLQTKNNIAHTWKGKGKDYKEAENIMITNKEWKEMR